jgi:hypothetical protein
LANKGYNAVIVSVIFFLLLATFYVIYDDKRLSDYVQLDEYSSYFSKSKQVNNSAKSHVTEDVNKSPDRDENQEQKEETPLPSRTDTKKSDQLNKNVNNPSYELDYIHNMGQNEQSKQNEKDNGEIIIFGEEDMTLRGVNGRKDIYFTLPPSSMGNESYVEITFSSSELLNPKLSSLTVLINGSPLKSIKLDKVFEFQTVRIPIKEEFLSKGFNSITIQSYTFINDDICTDQSDPSNWVIIHNTSYAFLDKGESLITSDFLKNFPYPFVTSGGQEEIQANIVIPDNSNGELIETSLLIAQYLSMETQSKKPVPILFESEWENDLNQKHVIAIGSINSWKGKLSTWLKSQSAVLTKDELLLHNVVDTSYGGVRQVLFVTALEAGTINEKRSILITPEVTKQLTGNSIKIKELPIVQDPSNQITSPQLNVTEQPIILDDSAQKSEKLYISIPSYWTIKDQGILELNFQYSALLRKYLDSDRKNEIALTTFINDIPFTVPLLSLIEDIDEGELIHYKLPVPQELLSKNESIVIEFEFNYPFTQHGCAQTSKSGNWLLIVPSTKLTIPFEITKKFTFSYWPAPLITNQGYEKVAIVTPGSVTKNALTQLSTLTNNLYSYDQRFQGFKVIRQETDELSQEILKDYHIILLSTHMKSYESFIRSTSNKLLVPWDEEKGFNLSKFGFIEETLNF